MKENTEIIQERRRASLNGIRMSLQTAELRHVMKRNSLNVETKLDRRQKRKQSIKSQDQNITEVQVDEIIEKMEREDQSVKTMGKFLEKYELGEKIGEGSNGLVRKCYLKTTRELFAVKTITLNEEHILFLKKNFKFIRALSHPNVIKYHFMYIFKAKNVCHLVMDYDSSPNLSSFQDLSQNQVKQIAFQLVHTLKYIHQHNICHRDIKPDNILYDRENKKIKLIDFGISRKLKERDQKIDMLTITGTLYYRAPEMFQGGGYDQKVDMWAVGITIYQLLAKKTPFQSEYLTTTIQNIREGDVKFDEEIWKQYSKFSRDIIVKILKNKSERLTAEEAKKHFWFSSDMQICEEVDLCKSANYIINTLKFQQRNTIRNKSGTVATFKVCRKVTIDTRIQSKQNQQIILNSQDCYQRQNQQKPKRLPFNRRFMSQSDDDALVQIEQQEEPRAKLVI